MEVIGFAASIVSLASLFSASLECWQFIDSARSHGRDYELLTTKLEVEKTRLLIWGDVVGIFRTIAEGRDEILDSPDVAPVVERILNCIVAVFTDSQALVSRYGLAQTGTMDDDPPSQSLSTNQLAKFRASYRRFKSRIKDVQDKPGILRKTRWVIQDQSKFIDLVNDLRQFVNGLKDITQSAANSSRERGAITEELEALPNIKAVKLVIDASKDVHDEWSDVASQVLEMSVLGSGDKDKIISWIKHTDDPEPSELLMSHEGPGRAKSNVASMNRFGSERFERLHWAAVTGNVDSVRSLLDGGIAIDHRDARGRTALHRAAISGMANGLGVLRAAQLLIDRGANIEARDSNGSTPLFLATEVGDTGMAQLLLKNGALVDTRERHLETPLIKAAQYGDCGTIQLLLDYGANINTKKDVGSTPLFETVYFQKSQAAVLLLNRGANTELVNHHEGGALSTAARRGYDEMVPLLLSKGANIEATHHEKTALYWAVREGHTAIVEGLLMNGADLRRGILEAAWWPNRTREIRVLIEYGADINERDDAGNTALIRSALRGHLENLETLLEYGAALDAGDDFGWTAIMKAAEAGHTSIVQFLAEKKANVRLTDTYGQTALQSSARDGHLETTEYIIELGLELNQRSHAGETALLQAARNGHHRVVDLLLSHGASKLIANHAGETPLYLARRNGNNETIKLLSDLPS